MTVPTPNLTAIILAAGKGTRMNSDLPKVVHPVGGRAMVCAVVDACREAGVGRVIVVVGHRRELVRDALAGFNVEFAVQDQQLGTGHAVQCTQSVYGKPEGDCLVLCGDGPLIRPATIRMLVERHRSASASATLATAVIDDPTGYGRILRDAQGRFQAIIEDRNCTPVQKTIREVNPSYYCFRAADLFAALRDVQRNPVSGEYYLTDVPGLLLARGCIVEVVPAVPPEDVLSINTPEELARVDAIFRSRGPGGKGAAA
jgi:bifunctional UDP-N-acetylglucosamine pyrophosphorylase/glucosamine-1-phosphate N-acetyltransferase